MSAPRAPHRQLGSNLDNAGGNDQPARRSSFVAGGYAALASVSLKEMLQRKRTSAGSIASIAAMEEKAQDSAEGGKESRRGASRSHVPKLSLSGLTAGANIATPTPQPPPAGSSSAPYRDSGSGSLYATVSPRRRGRTSRTSRRPGAPSPSDDASVPPLAPSPFVSLLNSRSGFQYFARTVFNKPLSAAHPNHNVHFFSARDSNNALSRGSAAGSHKGSTAGLHGSNLSQAELISRLEAQSRFQSAQIESDEDQDDFYSNEGGHASSFYQSTRSTARRHWGVAGSAAEAQRREEEKREEKRNRMLRSVLRKGGLGIIGALDDDDDDDELDEPNPLGLLRDDTPHSSAASLAVSSGHASAMAAKQKLRLSVRQQGVSAANIRRRLSSLTFDPATHLSSSSASPRTATGGGSLSARRRAEGLAPASRTRPTLGYLRDYPIEPVPQFSSSAAHDDEHAYGR